MDGRTRIVNNKIKSTVNLTLCRNFFDNVDCSTWEI